jgi:hypothetical protein
LHAGRRVLDHHRVARLDTELVRSGQEDLGVRLAVGEIASGDVGVEVIQQNEAGFYRR